MTLDEAIEHAEERARGNDQCAKDHAQLSDWLRELRRARMEIDLLKTLRNGFRADAQKYKTENAKLRELVETMHGDMREMLDTIDKGSDTWGYCRYYGECLDAAEGIMRELGIEVE